jgi:hypothetical protein
MLDFIFDNTGIDIDLDGLLYEAKQVVHSIDEMSIDIQEVVLVKLAEF